MKLVHKLTFALLSMFALGSACAAPMSDYIDENPNVNIGGNGNPTSFTFTHSLLDQPSEPYVAGFDSISFAKLTIGLQDTGGAETFTFTIDADGIVQTSNGSDLANGLSSHLIILGDTLEKFSQTGVLAVTIAANSGSFRFDSSLLEVEVTRGVDGGGGQTDVPEPFSLALMGLGLAGISVVRRRK